MKSLIKNRFIFKNGGPSSRPALSETVDNVDPIAESQKNLRSLSSTISTRPEINIKALNQFKELCGISADTNLDEGVVISKAGHDFDITLHTDKFGKLSLLISVDRNNDSPYLNLFTFNIKADGIYETAFDINHKFADADNKDIFWQKLLRVKHR